MPTHDATPENPDFVEALNVELRKIEDQIASLNSELEMVHGALERIRERLFDREDRKMKVLSLLGDDTELSIFENSRGSNEPNDSGTNGPGMAMPSRMVPTAPVRRRKPGNQVGSGPQTKRDTIREAVFNVLKGRENLELENRAMHYTDLVMEVGSKIPVGGQDPGLNLIAHIHRDERFKNARRDKKGKPHPYLKRGHYGLTEWYAKSPGSKPSHGK